MTKQGWWAAAYGGPWAAFGIGRRGLVLEFGELRLAILSLLDEGPKHGYQQLKEGAERFSAGFS